MAGRAPTFYVRGVAAAKPRRYNTQHAPLCMMAHRKGMSGCSLTYDRYCKLIVGHASAFPRNWRGTILSPSIYRDARPQQQCQQRRSPHPECMEDSPKAVVKPLSLDLLIMLSRWRVGNANFASAALVGVRVRLCGHLDTVVNVFHPLTEVYRLNCADCAAYG